MKIERHENIRGFQGNVVLVIACWNSAQIRKFCGIHYKKRSVFNMERV